MLAAEPCVSVVDDDELVLKSLERLLRSGGYAVRTFPSSHDYLAQRPAGPGCVVLDMSMPGLSGLELQKRLADSGDPCPVVFLSGRADIPATVEAMKAGAVDFIEKPFDDAVLIGAIRAALDARSSAQGDSIAKKEAEARLAELSPRERDVLQGLVAGKINKVIAHELNISPRTVEVYRANLMAKTGARSMSELMRIALAAGL